MMMESSFVPGMPMLSPEQQEEVIRNNFGIVTEKVVDEVLVVAEETKEEMVQLSKQQYEELISRSNHQQETPVVEEQEIVDPMSYIDQLFSFAQTEPVKKEEQVLKDIEVEEPKANTDYYDEIVRLKDESKNFYASIGQEAEKIGMNGNEAIGIVMAMSPTKLAEIAMIIKQVDAGKTADEILGKSQKPTMKTVATERPITVISGAGEVIRPREPNGFIS